MSKEILNRTESEWKTLIAQYESRSVTCAYFCKLHQVSKGGLKIQMQHKKIYDIKINNLSREKYVATYEHRRAY